MSDPIVHRRGWLIPLAIALATIVAYLPAYRAGYIWDDDFHVTKNLTLRSMGGLARIWFEPRATPQYYPLVHTSFWIEHHLWGLRPLGYHLVNVLLHAANALLLWRLLRLLNVPGAAWVAILFAVHPVHVESVAWISERKNVLSTLFYLLAASAWFHFRPPASDETDPSGRDRPVNDRPAAPAWYAAALILFIFALLSKTVTCTLPVALLIVAWWKRGSIRLRDVAMMLPFLLLGAALGLFTVWTERHVVGAEGDAWSLSALGRVMLAGRIAWFYALKDLWPRPLIFVYPRWQIDSAQLWNLVYPIGVALLGVALWLLRRRVGRGGLALLLFYLVTLFPALGFFNVYPMRYSYVADHFQYLASVAVFIAVVALLRPDLKTPAPFEQAAGAAIVLTLMVLTFARCRAYENSATLWRDTVAQNPGAWMAWQNLGAELQAEGKLDDAMKIYRHVLELRPGHGVAYNQMALIYLAQGDRLRAVEMFDEGLKHNPGSALLLTNLAEQRGQTGDHAGAEQAARQAIATAPDYVPALINLGQALLSQNRFAEAAETFERIIKLAPDIPAARLGLGVALANQGRLPDAAEQLRRALELDPNLKIARQILADILHRLGRPAEARQLLP